MNSVSEGRIEFSYVTRLDSQTRVAGRSILMSAVLARAERVGLRLRRVTSLERPADEHVLLWDGPYTSVHLDRCAGDHRLDSVGIQVFVPWVDETTEDPGVTWRVFAQAAADVVAELQRRLTAARPDETNVAELLDRAGVPSGGTLTQRFEHLLREYADLIARIGAPIDAEQDAHAARVEAHLRDVMRVLGTAQMSRASYEVQRLQAALVRATSELRTAQDTAVRYQVQLEQLLANTKRRGLPLPHNAGAIRPQAFGAVPQRVFVLAADAEGVTAHGIVLACRSDGKTFEFATLMCNEYGDPLLHLGLSWVDADRIRQSPYPLLPR